MERELIKDWQIILQFMTVHSQGLIPEIILAKCRTGTEQVGRVQSVTSAVINIALGIICKKCVPCPEKIPMI